jgi:flagellar motor switch protein FliN/FliY
MGIYMSNEYSAMPIQNIELAEIDASDQPGKKILGNTMDIIRDVKVRIQVTAGYCDLTVRELLDLRENAVLTLDKSTHDPVDVLVDGKVVARGMLVAVGDNFGVRITEIHGS